MELAKVDKRKVVVVESETPDLARIWEGLGSLSRVSRLDTLYGSVWRALRFLVGSSTTAMISLVSITVSLFLFALFMWGYQNLSRHLKMSEGSRQAYVFVKPSASSEEIDGLKKTISEGFTLDSIEVKDSDAVRSDLKSTLDEEAVGFLESIDSDYKFPSAIELRFSEQGFSKEEVSRLRNAFQNNRVIDDIVVNTELVSQAYDTTESLRIVATLVVLILVLISAFVIVTTVSLALYAHREEIEIMRLVGATNNFIIAPYVVEGGIQGILGAGLAVGLLYGLNTILMALSSESYLLKVAFSDVEFLSLFGILSILGLGLLVGIFSSLFAVSRYLTTNERI